LIEWLPEPVVWPMSLLPLSRLFIDPLVVLFVAGRLLQKQLTSGEDTWRPVAKTAVRLYLRAFLIGVVLVIPNYFVFTALSVDPSADAELAARLKMATLWLPLSIFKILWLSALVARGRGLFKTAVRAIVLICRSPLVLIACGAWAIALYFERLFIPEQLQAGSVSLAIGWWLASSAVVAVTLRFVYTAALDQYAAHFGIESPEFQAIPVGGSEAGTAVLPETSISLWWTFLSIVPVLSLVAFLKGRGAVRRLHWRSIRAVLAYSFGLFFTIVHLLVLVGANLPRRAEAPPVDYTFLSRADASVESQVKLLAAGEFLQAHDQLMKPTPEASAKSWSRLTALAVAQNNLQQPDEALVNLEKASSLKPARGEFHYLYGRLLLDQGQRSRAEQQFVQASRLGIKPEWTLPLLSLARSSYEPRFWVGIVWSVVILVLLFTVHEFAHAYTAFKLGDDTAKEQGRLTLNPIAHLDLFGSLILPGLLLWRQSDVLFGWAKPVPVNPEKFANPKRDHMLVSFAGPAANLVVAMGAALLILLILVDVRILSPDAQSLELAYPSSSVSLSGSRLPVWIAPVIAFLKQLTLTSLILACFNLIPMPPLDGSWILSGLAPERFQAKFEAIRPYGFIIFLALMWTPVFDYLLAIPIGLLWAGAMACFSLMGFS